MFVYFIVVNLIHLFASFIYFIINISLWLILDEL